MVHRTEPVMLQLQATVCSVPRFTKQRLRVNLRRSENRATSQCAACLRVYAAAAAAAAHVHAATATAQLFSNKIVLLFLLPSWRIQYPYQATDVHDILRIILMTLQDRPHSKCLSQNRRASQMSAMSTNTCSPAGRLVSRSDSKFMCGCVC